VIPFIRTHHILVIEETNFLLTKPVGETALITFNKISSKIQEGLKSVYIIQ